MLIEERGNSYTNGTVLLQIIFFQLVSTATTVISRLPLPVYTSP